jgi:hypothetical protein
MITNCGHTVCEDCALKLNACPVCRLDYAQWMLIDNYILIDSETRAKKQPTGEGTEFETLLQARRQRQSLIAETYIEKTSQEIVDLVRKSLLDDPIKCHFCYVIKAEDPFYGNLINRVVHRIQRSLDHHQMEVKIEHPGYGTLTEKPNYSYNIVISVC